MKKCGSFSHDGRKANLIKMHRGSSLYKNSPKYLFCPPFTKNSTSFDLSIFLFKPQAWYVITRQRVWYCQRRMASPKVHFLRLDSIPSCNGFHTMLCIDSIHASRRDVAHGFKPIRKLTNISFSSVFHK